MYGLYDGVDEDEFRDCTIYESDFQLKRKIGRP